MSEKIKYREGYKYQLVDPYIYQTDIFGLNLKNDYVTLAPDGTLYIYGGYAWDGASGPTVDTKDSMRASLVHDALYALTSEYPDSLLKWRGYVDSLLENICVEDGMSAARAWAWRKAVTLFGERAATQSSQSQI